MGGTLGYDVDMVYPISLSAGYEKVSNGQGVFTFDKRVSLGANAQLNDNTSFGLNYTNLKNDNKNIRIGVGTAAAAGAPVPLQTLMVTSNTGGASGNGIINPGASNFSKISQVMAEVRFSF